MYRSASFPSLPEECEKDIDKDILTNNRLDSSISGLGPFPNIRDNNMENVPFTPQRSHVIGNGQSASSILSSEPSLPPMFPKGPQNVYMNQMPLTSSVVSGVSGLNEQYSSYPPFHVNAAGNLFLPLQSNQMTGSGYHMSSRPFPVPEVPPPGMTASYFPNPPYTSLPEITSFGEFNPGQSLHPASECQTSARDEHFPARSGRDQILPACEQQNQQSQYHQTTSLAGVEPPNAGETQPPSLIGERQEARIQVPQPTLTNLNPTVQSKIQGIRNIPQGFLIPPEIGQRPRHPPTEDCFRIAGQQLTPTIPTGAYYDPAILQSIPSNAYQRSQLPPPPPPPPHWYTRPPVPPPYTFYGQQQNSLHYFQGLPVVYPNIGAQPVIHPTPYSSLYIAPVNTAVQHQAKGPELTDASTETLRKHRNVAKQRTIYGDKEKYSRWFRRSPEKENVDDTEDTSDSSTGSDEKAAPQPQTIKIRGVMDSKMAAICKHYFENPDKGGGKIQEFKWDNIEHIFYIKFADAKVAKRVSSSVHKIGDRQLEISLAPGGIPECVGLRTVEISGGDVDFIEVYRQYFENPVNGGGAISKIWAEEQQLFITFKDAAVAETVCCKSHTVEEHTLVAKLANMTQGTDPKRDLEHLNEEWTTVECSVGPHLRDKEFYRQYFETVESGGLVEDIIINTEDRKVLVTFDSGKVARQVASGKHRIDGKDVNVQLMKTSPFYQSKLLFRNVNRNVHKELLMNYMESISGQEDIQLIYSDVPGDVLVTFQNKIDFSKIREKCQTKLLSGIKLEVHRVPVSKCVIVSNLNPNTSDDEVAHYFETLGGGGVGAVLKVLPGKDNTKYIFLKDPEVAQGVATKSHWLGGRELVVRLYLTCLGPSGGKEDPYVFILPEPLELYENTDIKVCYLRHNSRILQTFNESLSTMHAHAKIVENVLKVECTLNESEPNVHLLVDSWKDEVQKELGTCLDFVRLDRQDVLPEIWPEVMKAIEKCEVCGDDLLLPIPQEHAFLILSIRSKEGGTFEKIQSIVEDAEKELTFKKQEVSETKQLKKHERDILMLSSFLSDVQNQYTRLKVNIHQQEAAITFCGQLVDIRDAQRVMLETIRSASSTIMKDMPKSKMSLLANGNSHDLIQKRLISSELAATWDYHNEGVVTVFCLKESDLHRAVEVIQTSFREETILLDEISSEITGLARWGKLKDDLMQYHRGILTISANPNTMTITAFSDIMPDVREAVENFIAENSIYSAVFSFSPSRQKYLATFWEERLTDITEKQSVDKVKIHWMTRKGTSSLKEQRREYNLLRNTWRH